MADFVDDYEYLERQLDPKPQFPTLEQPEEDNNSKDKDRERRREKDERRDKDRDRDRGRRDRDERSDRDRHRDRDRRDERPRDRDRDRSGRSDRGDYRDRRMDDRPSNSRRERERTPPEVRLQREQERELREMERSTRTVFAQNINLKAEEFDIFKFFSKAGKVLDVKLITDKSTKRSKGFAYIEFEKQEDVIAAIGLTGQMFLNQPVMVKSSEAEKNLAWEAQEQAKQNQAAAAALLGTTGTTTVPTAAGPARLYVGNLNPQVLEADLQGLFAPFGKVDAVQVVRDSTGTSQGYAYVQYSSVSEATAAMAHWDGKAVAGAPLKVSLVPAAPTAPVLPQAAAGAAAIVQQHESIAELDEEEEKGGLKLTSKARQALMSRLATSAGLQAPPSMFPGAGQAPATGVPAGPRVDPMLTLEQGMLGPSSPIPTPCLLLKNMFDPQQESGADWEVEIGEDVKEECSKYGQVLHVYVDKNSKGFVYMKLASAEGAAAAQRALHGRFFAGRQIAAEFQFAHTYQAVFAH